MPPDFRLSSLEAATATAVPAATTDGADDEQDEEDDKEQLKHALTVPHMADA
jgi:hypothetical protein